MTDLFVETSAALRATLEGDEDLLETLAAAARLTASSLCLVEADRALRRAFLVDRLAPGDLQVASDRFDRLVANMGILALDADVMSRAKRTFPVEPVRALDALHLASALALRDLAGVTAIASCDRRVRDNAAALGFAVLP